MSDRAKGKLDRGRAQYLQRLAAQRSAEHAAFFGEGVQDGNPLLITPGSSKSVGYGPQLSTGSIRNGEEVAVFRGDGISRVVGRDRIIRVVEPPAVVPVLPDTELAWVMTYDNFGGSGGIDVQKYYVGGMVPTTLVYEFNGTLTPGASQFRNRSHVCAIAYEPRGVVLEIRKGRMFPFALQPTETPPDDYDAQLLNPTSDYYRFVNKRAFLIAPDATVTEIAPGSSPLIGAWDYSTWEYNYYVYSDTFSTADYCADLILQPTTEHNRSALGRITVPLAIMPTVGSNVLLSFRGTSDYVTNEFFLYDRPTATVYLCDATLSTSQYSCSATINSFKPYTIQKPTSIVSGVTVGTYRFTLSGLLDFTS